MSQELKIVFGPKAVAMIMVMFYHQSMTKSPAEQARERDAVQLFFACEGQAAFSILPDKVVWFKDGSWEVAGVSIGGESRAKISASFIGYETECKGTVTVE